MKNIILLSILFSHCFPMVVNAEEISLIPIGKPVMLDEGTQRELSASQIAELVPWAKDSKSFLIDLVENVQSIPTIDKVERLIEGIKSSVIESAPKNSELLMRYALNRALIINETLDKEMDPLAVGTIDAKSRVLQLSISMALKYYDADMDTLSKKSPTPFASFGVEYFTFLTELNKSIFDASAQYSIQRISFEWLQWDLYRDLNNATYASKIVKINNSLKSFPAKRFSDAQSINFIRQMKKVTAQLELIIKPAAESTKPVAISIETQVKPIASEAKKNRFFYNSSNNVCYRLSADNQIMYNAPVDDNNCFGGNYIYSNSNLSCYKLSTGNDIMYNSRVNDDYCSNGKYLYSTSNYQCYKSTTKNDIMFSSPVNDTFCASGRYQYSSSNNGCYKVSSDNDIMYSSPVSSKYCQ